MVKIKNRKIVHYLNGKFVTDEEAKISIFDLGVLRAYGVFDYLVTYKEKPFLLYKHIKRLFRSAKIIGLKIGLTEDEIEKLVLKTLSKNRNGKEKSIRILVTGGVSSDAMEPSSKSTLAILISNRHFLNSELYKNGAHVITIDAFRDNPMAKSINYTIAVKANLDAKKAGAIEAVYVDTKNNKIFEGTTSNVFIVKKSKIFTPHKDTLPGITRELVISLGRQKFPIQVKDLTLDELNKADEIFISASNKEVLPVVKVNKRIIGNGKPGVTTKVIMKLYRDYVASDKW